MDLKNSELNSIYFPDNEDILNWLQENKKWPASDWDYYVINGKNDRLLMELANDTECVERDFFIHTLYLLVGTYKNGETNNNQSNRISVLLATVDENSTDEVKEWKRNTIDLFLGDIKFDKNFWLDYLFYGK